MDGKSDIKLIEALAYGLVPVCSRASPYTDSRLPGAVLADNTYEAWLDALDAGRAACQAGQSGQEWPEDRDSAASGLAPWASALARVRLPTPVTAAEVRAAQAAARAMESPNLAREDFDEAHYLDLHDDVREAVEGGGLASGFDHYVTAGRAERRTARRIASAAGVADAWWAGLLHEVGQLRAAADRRDVALAELERRLALRRVLVR